MHAAALIEAFLRSRAAAQRADATIDWYVAILSTLADSCPGQLTTEALELWLARSASPQTARSRLRAARALCNWAQRRYGTPSPAAAIVPPLAQPKLPRVFTQSELKRIFQVASDPRDVAAITILLDTGVRIGELASMRAEWIDQEGATVQGKRGQRRIPLSSESRRAIMRLAVNDGPIFLTTQGRPARPRASHPVPIDGPRHRGGQPGNRNRLDHGRYSLLRRSERVATPMAEGSLNDRIRDLVRAAGVTGSKLGPHTFRHTFATMYLRAGGDLYRLQRLMGHANIKQTQVYLHLADPEAWEEHERLSPLAQLRRAN